VTAALDARQYAALEQAANWCVRLNGDNTDTEAWQHWLQAAPENQWAWQQAERLQQRLQAMPTRVAGRALDLAAQQHRANRRSVLKGFALLLGGSSLGWAGYQQHRSSPWLAQHRTAVGERLTITLADGGQVQLNTNSALDVQYDNQQRLLILRQGEILIRTAADPQGRPFFVQTPHGTVRALGTRFSVRVSGEQTDVAVFEHKVQLSPTHGMPALLETGQQASFTAAQTQPEHPLADGQDAWSKGLLIANNKPLGEVIAELARYRHGWLRCDPAIANLRISGTFNLDNPKQALRAVASALPVRIEERTRYWVTLRAV
jgi:transmembrane sensor